MVGLARSGDVEGSAVIDRGAVDRQAERDVHGGVEGDELDRDVALVVILRDDQIEGAVIGAVEDRVGRNRPDDVDPLRARQRDRRRDLSSSSVPNRPFSPQCGLMPATAMRGARVARCAADARGRRDRRQHPLGRRPLDRRPAARHASRRG